MSTIHGKENYTWESDFKNLGIQIVWLVWLEEIQDIGIFTFKSLSLDNILYLCNKWFSGQQ